MSSAKSNATTKPGVKRSRSINGDNDATEKNTKNTKLSTATHTTQLSGATKNMRFMQRGKSANNMTSRHSYPPHQNKIIATTETEEVELASKTLDGNDDSSPCFHRPNEEVVVSGDGIRESMSALPKVNNFTVKWERATPLDMYGENACILLGRRSYNGFNSTTASNLHMQQQHLDYEEKMKRRRNTNRDGTSKDMNSIDDRRRYKELSKQVQNDEREATGGKMSKKKKRTLDDILKLVDS